LETAMTASHLKREYLSAFECNSQRHAQMRFAFEQLLFPTAAMQSRFPCPGFRAFCFHDQKTRICGSQKWRSSVRLVAAGEQGIEYLLGYMGRALFEGRVGQASPYFRRPAEWRLDGLHFLSRDHSRPGVVRSGPARRASDSSSRCAGG